MITLILLSFFIALVIFAIITFCLDKSHTELQHIMTLEQQRRRWTGLFVLTVLALIMTMTGINSFMNTRA